MAYVIAEPCVDELDQSCVTVCPVDCIQFEESVDRKAYINPDECIDCGACEPECPVTAIFTAEGLPPKWEDHAANNALWFADRSQARAALSNMIAG